MSRITTTFGVIFSFVIFVLLGVSGCGTMNIPMQVTHPAEINMTPYKQIALSDIGGNMGRSFSDNLKNLLVESGRFQVVERSRLDQIMKELNLSQSDLTDETNRTKLGKLMTASAMIAGHTESSYDEKMTYENATCGSKDKKYPCKNYYLTGVFKTSGSIDVIDIQTGQIIKNKTLNNKCEVTHSATDAKPELIDKDALASTCLTQNLEVFMKAISPWTEVVQAPFQTDKAIPDLEQGATKAKMGDLNEAATIFANAAKAAEGNAAIKPQSIAKAYFNLGLCYEYTDEFDKAIEAFKKAYSIDSNDIFLKEKSHAETLKRERSKLAEQGK